MNATSLAEQFNDVGRNLEASGHRIIMRRVRELLEAEDAHGALGFLRSAGAVHGELGGLTQSLESFLGDGGEPLVLIAEQAWRSGSEYERRFEAQIELATGRRDLHTLVQAVTEHSAKAAQGAPFEPISTGLLAPETPPAPVRDEGLMVRDINLPELEDESGVHHRPGAVATPIAPEETPPQVDAPSAEVAPTESPATPTQPTKPGLSGKVVVLVVLGLVAIGYATVAYMLKS